MSGYFDDPEIGGVEPPPDDEPFDVFFYGLYMDQRLLAQRGVVARDPRMAWIADYGVSLRKKAVLFPDAGSRAFGMVFGLTLRELALLYWEQAEYRAEALVAHGLDGDIFHVVSMISSDPEHCFEADENYADQWRAIALDLGLPDAVPNQFLEKNFT